MSDIFSYLMKVGGGQKVMFFYFSSCKSMKKVAWILLDFSSAENNCLKERGFLFFCSNMKKLNS